ncbi:unnamed protein product [Rhizophagus irregularis]|nr:unnamed protein product [Rhizophagus irregularis]
MNKVAINGNNILSRFKLMTKHGVIKPSTLILNSVTVRDGLPFELLERYSKLHMKVLYSRLALSLQLCIRVPNVQTSHKTGTVCGKYIRKLNMDGVKLWPICIVKMLQACPNIQELSIIDYQYYGGKGDVRDLLSEILHILPNLQKLDIRYSRYFKNRNAIEKLIETRKDLEIRVTCKCNICKG